MFSRANDSRKNLTIDIIKKNPVPLHIAVIMDGNGRWATRKGLPRIAGHREGVKSLKCIVRLCADLGIRYVTAYAFSSENWKRPVSEVSGLMKLFYETLASELEDLNKNGVKIILLGDRGNIPEKVLKRFQEAEEITENNKKVILNIAFNYGARQEIINSVKKICSLLNEGSIKADEINEKIFSDFLYTKDLPDPDLLIRTSGEYRISNFLLWQTAYSEFYFTRTLWPDFRENEFFKAISEYQKRNRRFGKI
ncbi:MAG: isoprenyl transferase [Actinomycetota bacterium]|nr:isoprenyl transferase [Actinomycetota bacterium]